MWPADARAFSRPAPKAREKRPGDEVGQGDQWRGKVSDYGTANFMQQTMTVAPGAMIYSAPEALSSNQTPKVGNRLFQIWALHDHSTGAQFGGLGLLLIIQISLVLLLLPVPLDKILFPHKERKKSCIRVREMS